MREEHALIDAYADGAIAAADLQRLQILLRTDPSVRRAFWRRMQLHAQLGAACRAAGGRALALPARRPLAWRWPLAAAASLLLAAAALWLARPAAELPSRDGHRLAVGTAVTGPALLRWDDGSSIELAGGARAQARDARRGAALFLADGAIAVRVAHRPAGRGFAVATPQAQAVVLGTAFRLAVAAGTTVLAVQEGVVRLGNPAGAVEVRAGAAAMVRADAAPLPVGSVVHADAARDDAQRLADALRPGDTLVLHGTWSRPLRLARAGLPGLPITVRGAEDALLAGDEILSGWERSDDGLWHARAAWSLATAQRPLGQDMLLIDGRPVPLAAWPADADAIAGDGTAVAGESGGFARTAVRLPGLPAGDLSAAFLRWGGQTGRIVGRDGDVVQVLTPPGAPPPRAGDALRAMGAPAFALRPGMWCRTGTGVLLRLADDDHPSARRISLQRHRTMLELRGAAQVRVADLTIRAGAVDIDAASVGVELDGLTLLHPAAAGGPAVVVAAPGTRLSRIAVSGEDRRIEVDADGVAVEDCGTAVIDLAPGRRLLSADRGTVR